MSVEELIERVESKTEAEYIDMLGVEPNDHGISRSQLSKHVFTHYNRLHSNIVMMKHTYLFFKTNILTVCFKITLAYTSCIYAYVYFECDGQTFKPMYYSASPTYRSQDGEYRSRILPWEQMSMVYSDKLRAKWLEKIEESAVSKIALNLLSIHADYYLPMGCTADTKTVDDFIQSSRIPLKLYCMCWVADFDAIYCKSIENHINPAYQYIFFQKDDIPLYKKILDVHGRAWYDLFVYECTYCVEPGSFNPNKILPLRCGQKIFPLTSVEAIKTNDIRFAVWREIYINTLVSNLVLNLLSPSFAFINSWFYVQNARAELYDNIAMHEKYIHSEIAGDISNQLRNLNSYNYIEQDRAKGAISGKFTKLARSINKAIVYADSSIKLTDLAICMVGEYVGRTLRDIPTLVRSNDRSFGEFDLFSDIVIFSKHVFEFVYACLCMNVKTGIIHSDLHMNNATMNRMFMPKNIKAPNPHCAYIYGSECYTFPYDGVYSTIIDFSKALIGSFEHLEREFGIKYADEYFREQRRAVLHTLQKYFPRTMSKYSNEVEALLLANFPLMFKIISALDPYVLCSNMIAMLSVDESIIRGRIELSKDILSLLEEMSAAAEEYVVENIKRAIERSITSPSDIEWPNHTLIKKFFSKYLIDAETSKGRSYIEVFNGNNAVKYDIDDPNNWGPIISTDEYIAALKKAKEPLPDGYKEWVEFQNSDDHPRIEKLRSKYVSREADVLQFEDWMVL